MPARALALPGSQRNIASPDSTEARAVVIRTTPPGASTMPLNVGSTTVYTSKESTVATPLRTQPQSG